MELVINLLRKKKKRGGSKRVTLLSAFALGDEGLKIQIDELHACIFIFGLGSDGVFGRFCHFSPWRKYPLPEGFVWLGRPDRKGKFLIEQGKEERRSRVSFEKRGKERKRRSGVGVTMVPQTLT